MKHFYTQRTVRNLLIILLICILGTNLYGQIPTISSFSPTSGPVGTTVTISGTNFNTTTANNIVVFGATAATVTSATSTTLTVTVPVGATHDFILVLNSANGLMANSDIKFIPTYTPNTGTITASDFQSAFVIPAVENTINVAMADLDGDGKPDFALHGEEGIISVLRNTSTPGTISCNSSIDLPPRNSQAYSINDISIGDIDGDSKPDLVSTYRVWDGSNSFNYVSVYRNTSTPGVINFEGRVDFGGDLGDDEVSRILDIDGDGKLDIVVNKPANTKFVLRNTSTVGNISFDEPVYLNGPNVHEEDLQVGDLDGDGKPDLAFTSFLYGYVSILRNTSEIGTISFATYVNFPVGTVQSKGLFIGDLDGDGMLDIAVVSDQFYISLLRNISSPGTLAFESSINIFTGANSTSIPLGDIDGDGKLDMATQQHGYNKLFLYKNLSSIGAISFADRVEIPGNVYGLKIADVDGDGIPELLGAGYGALIIFRNSPTGLGIEETNQVANLTVYPNPVQDQLTIKSNNNIHIQSIEILDVSGRMLQTIHPDVLSEINIDVSHLSAGNYILKVASERGTTVKKFIKM